MSDNDQDHWDDDLAAYMLGALEPGEAAELERHAEGCERCRELVRWLGPAVQALPEAVKRVEPPRELRSRLMAEVRADARQAGVPANSTDAGPGRRASDWLRRLGSGPMGLRAAAGLTAAVLVVAILAGYTIGNGGSGDGGRVSTIAVGHAPGVTAEVVREGDGGTLRLANVDQLPNDKVLEAWVRREGNIVPVRALFVPDREGRASTTIANMHDVEAVMVTAEPRGGSSHPTSTPIVTIPIPQ